MIFKDEHHGTAYRYRSTLRPIASIGYDQIPDILLEPGADPTSTAREFYTAALILDRLVDRFDLQLLGVEELP